MPRWLHFNSAQLYAVRVKLISHLHRCIRTGSSIRKQLYFIVQVLHFPLTDISRTCGRPWVHQICRDMGVTATEALLLVEDRPF